MYARARYLIKKPERIVADNSPSLSQDGKSGKSVVASPAETAKPSWLAELLGGTRLQVGIDNVADTPPPFAAGAFNDNDDTSLFSNRGRFYYVNIQKQF